MSRAQYLLLRELLHQLRSYRARARLHYHRERNGYARRRQGRR